MASSLLKFTTMKKIILILLALISLPVFGQTKIFPGAVGYGTESRGAFELYKQTGLAADYPKTLYINTLSSGYSNTNDSVGSFRWAIDQIFPRIITFEVGGVIDYAGVTSAIKIKNGGYCNIYGQTAPDNGIVIYGTTFQIEDPHILIQHMKFRLGDEYSGDGNNGDAVLLYWDSTVVFDHCEFMWSLDEAFDMSNSHDGNITVSNSLFAQPLRSSRHYSGGLPEEHHYHALTYEGPKTFTRNLFAFGMDRQPLLRGDSSQVINNWSINSRYPDFILNSNGDPDLFFVDAIGNQNDSITDPYNLGVTDKAGYVATSIPAGSKLYLLDNDCPELRDNPGYSQRQLIYNVANINESTTPLTDTTGFNILSSSQVRDTLLAKVGAFWWNRDTVTTTILDSVEVKANYIIDSQDSLQAREYNHYLGDNSGDMTSGHDWSSGNETIILNSSPYTLTANCATITDVVNHINSVLPVGYECWRLNGVEDLDNVGIRTTSVGSAQSFGLTGTALSTLGWQSGTKTGTDGVPGWYEQKTAAATTHTLSVPIDTNVTASLYYPIEVWADSLANPLSPTPTTPEQYPNFIKKDGKYYFVRDENFTSYYLALDYSLTSGLILNLIADSISEDSLTYNSSGDLVTYANIDTVILDGNLEVVIGNSVRFGIPGSGTIYQVLDTLGSSDSLILDQTFTGSVTDEYFWGGINTWYDESGEGNNAIQTTAINQPKLLWAGTDSAEVCFDGINDNLIVLKSGLDIIDKSVTFYCNFNIKDNGFRQNLFDNGAGGGLQGYSSEIKANNQLEFRINDGTGTNLFTIETITVDVNYNPVELLDLFNDKMEIYFSGTLQAFNTRDAGNITPARDLYIGSSAFNIRYLDGNITEFRLYNRALSNKESIILSQ